MKYRNHGYKHPDQLLNNPSNIELSPRDLFTSGAEEGTLPPEFHTDDEMEELIKEVKSAEDELRSKDPAS